jgi:cytochrome bd ubiquinol oxidase subunit II
VVIVGYFQSGLFSRLGVNPGAAPITAGLAALASGWFVNEKRFGWAFVSMAVTLVLSTVTVFFGLFPRVMISSLNPAWSLTIYTASSSQYTLTVMSIVALIFVPIVLVYQAWNYYVFRQRVTGKGAHS